MKHVRLACAITLLSAAAVTGTEAPYFGKWKVNAVTGAGINSIEKLPSGYYRFEADGFTYKFKLDGNEYPMPDGGTTSWKAVDDQTWEITNRANGKVTAMFKLTVSGDELTSSVTVPQEDGKSITTTGTFKRISGGPGVPGRWKPTKVDASEVWLSLTPDGTDGLKMGAPNSLCVAKFDGKPYPMSGPGDAPKQTMAFRKRGPSSFEALTYIDGKLFFTDVYSVSVDGKVLTDIATPAATKKPSKTIFDRQ